MLKENNMKKVFRTIISILFTIAMTSPSGALATTVQEVEETVDERETKVFDCEEYSLIFLTGDFELSLSRSNVVDQAGSLVLFLTNPDGKIIKDAQVVTTIVGQNGSQIMHRARPFKNAYLIDTGQLMPDRYRLEAEIVTNGRLLTDEFFFQHT
jgi:hypothetical protein